MKGAKYMELRQWQKEAYEAWTLKPSKSPFLLVAVPAGGKTFVSLWTFREWRRAGRDRRLIVVVPTSNLQEQWRDEAAKLGIHLQTQDIGNACTYSSEFQGCALTYSMVARNPLVVRTLVQSAKFMVVLDEAHHCGDQATWGGAIRDAFEPSEERLLLSGTPFRTDGTPIPFVEYGDDGFCKADYTFDYVRALKDGVIRYLAFEYNKGSYTGYDGEKEVTYEVSSEVSPEESGIRLAYLLNTKGRYVREVVRSAHDKLMQLRQTIPDAAGLAACVDQTHAMCVADVIREVTGCNPKVIVSDDSKSNITVDQFRNSRDEWVVAVRQVAEGTDIKRLQVLCYFTNCVTDMFFRQLVGRVQRRRNGTDVQAYVFLPADPRLIECAQRIHDMQVQALKSLEEEKRDESNLSERQSIKPSFEFYDSEHHGVEFTLIGSERYTEEEYQRISHMASVVGTSLELAAKMWKASHEPIQNKHVEVVTPLEVEKQKVKDRINNIWIRRIVSITGESHRDAHTNHRPKPFRSIHTLTLPELLQEEMFVKNKLALLEKSARAGR